MLRWLFNIFRRNHKKIIVISPRWSDIWAGLENDVYGAGKSVREALGDLVLHHPEKFGIDIKMAFGGKPERPFCGLYITISEQQYDAMIHAAKWSSK